MPLGPTDLFWIGLVPCALSALALWLAARLGLRATAAWALAVGGTIFLGMTLQHSRTSWQTAWDKLLHPRVGLEWLPWLVLLAALISIYAQTAPKSWREFAALGGVPLRVLQAIFVIAVPLRLLASNAADMTRWTLAQKLGVLALWSLLIAALWTTLALGRRNGQPILRSLLLIVTSLGAALTLMASHSLTHFEYTLIVTATLAGAVTAAWWTDRIEPSRAAGPVAVALLGLILLGNSYDLTATNAALLSLALAASAGWLPESWPPQPIARAALRTALTFVPVALAVALAIGAASADPWR